MKWLWLRNFARVSKCLWKAFQWWLCCTGMLATKQTTKKNKRAHKTDFLTTKHRKLEAAISAHQLHSSSVCSTIDNLHSLIPIWILGKSVNQPVQALSVPTCTIPLSVCPTVYNPCSRCPSGYWGRVLTNQYTSAWTHYAFTLWGTQTDHMVESIQELLDRIN